MESLHLLMMCLDTANLQTRVGSFRLCVARCFAPAADTETVASEPCVW